MGESKKIGLRPHFDWRLKLEFHGAKITSDAGLLAYREMDEVMGVTEMSISHLTDYRTGKNTQHTLLEMLRQAIYGRLAGYEDLNDADRLRFDPAMKTVLGERAVENSGASTSEMWRFETGILPRRDNLRALMSLPGGFVDRAHEHKAVSELVLDMDSSVSETYGEQQGSAYNGYFTCNCYHPLFLFNQHCDLEYAMLRRGNQHSAKYWKKARLPVIERYRHFDIPHFFRGDVAFAMSELYDLLEREEFKYTIRLKANPILEDKISHLLTRPVGRPTYAWTKGVLPFF